MSDLDAQRQQFAEPSDVVSPDPATVTTCLRSLQASERSKLTNVIEAHCAALSVVVRYAATGERLERAHAQLEITSCCDRGQYEVSYRSSTGEPLQRLVGGRHVSIVPSHRPHRMIWRRGGELASFLFAPHFITQLAERLGLPRVELVEDYAALDPVIWHLAREVRQEMQMGTCLSTSYLESVATVLGRHVLKTYSATETTPTQHGALPQYLLRRSLAYIDSRIDQEITLAALAEMAKMSPFHYARLFKRATGETPYQFVLGRRIAKAKTLLADTALSIAEVAYRVGYESQSHFTTCFGKMTGVTPAKFRRGAA